MFDWVNNLFHSFFGWFTSPPTKTDPKQLNYLDLDDDFFKECKVLTNEEIAAQYQLSQSMPSLKDHYQLVKEQSDDNNDNKDNKKENNEKDSTIPTSR